MSVLPQGWRGSTTLNTSITSYDTLSVRIQHQLGAPLINLEVFDEQVYSFIDEAIELFTKWAGYTEEYMIFDYRSEELCNKLQYFSTHDVTRIAFPLVH